VTPRFAALTSLALLASMGMPGLAGFVSEFHALLGGVGRFRGAAAVAAIGVLVTAAYSLRAISKLFFGPVNPRWAGLGDAGARELVAVAPLGALMVGLGIAPGVALDLLTITARQMTAMFP
jgi:NADH-quinone oxidoreductase subunit M